MVLNLVFFLYSSAFFDAVEHQDLDEVEAILKWNTLDVNQANSDDFTALDIAIMTNNMPMARLLLANGARENSRCKFLILYSRS